MGLYHVMLSSKSKGTSRDTVLLLSSRGRTTKSKVRPSVEAISTQYSTHRKDLTPIMVA